MVHSSLFRVVLFFCLTAVLGGCGYYFPHVYTGEEKVLYMPEWKNRTNELGLDAKIYQSLASWFRKSSAIRVSKEKESADLILAGEIMSISLPSVAWNQSARAGEIRIRLRVRYVLKDMKSGDILWEVPTEFWTDEYASQGLASRVATDQESAMRQIIDDMSEHIYLGTLERLRRQNMKQQSATQKAPEQTKPAKPATQQ